jgi:hypothetical protein
MSRPQRAAVASVLVAWATASGSVAGCQTDQELRERLDSLAPLREAARLASQAAEAERAARRIAQNRLQTDTIAVGPLRIIVRLGQSETARELFRTIWAREYASFIDAPAQASVEYFTFAWPNSEEPLPVSSQEPVRRVELRPWRSRRAVERVIRQQIAAMLGAEISDTPLGSWINGEIRAPADPAEIYRTIALAGAESTRRCLEGVAERCWDALGADLTQDPYPLDDWYSGEERVQLAQLWLQRARSSSDDRIDACLRRTSVADCDALLAERLGPWGGGDPFQHGGPRAYLTWLALRAGGAGAWTRMTTDRDATPGEALRAASGMDTAALAALWRDEVIEARAAPRRVLDRSLLLALAWMGILATFATRSTRWRLG